MNTSSHTPVVVLGLVVAAVFLGSWSARVDVLARTQNKPRQHYSTDAAAGKVEVDELGPGARGCMWQVSLRSETGRPERVFNVSTPTSCRLAGVYGHAAHVVLFGELGGGVTLVTIVDIPSQQITGELMAGLLRASPSGRYLAYAINGPNRTRLKSDDRPMVADLWTDQSGQPDEAYVSDELCPPSDAAVETLSAMMAVPQWVNETTVAFALAESEEEERPHVTIVCADLKAGVNKARTAAKPLATEDIARAGQLGSLNPASPGVVIAGIEHVAGDGMVLRVRFGEAGAPKVPYVDVRMW